MMNKKLLYRNIEKDIEQRKKIKTHVDKMINLGQSFNDDTIKLNTGDLDYMENNTYNRLLDEGAVIRQGKIDFYIPKGELEKAVNLLDDETQYYINKGHVPYEVDARDYGYFTKNDLKLVDIGEGRKALDVNVHLNENNAYIQELRINKNPVGLSIEMAGKKNKDLSKEYGVEVVQDLKIKGLAIVGNVGNVNSYNFKLNNGGKKVKETWLSKYLGNKKKEEDIDDDLSIEEKYEKLSAKVIEMSSEVEEKINLYEEALKDVSEENIELKEKLSEKEEEVKELNTKLSNYEAGENKKEEEIEKALSALSEHIKKFGTENLGDEGSGDKKIKLDEWGNR